MRTPSCCTPERILSPVSPHVLPVHVRTSCTCVTRVQARVKAHALHAGVLHFLHPYVNISPPPGLMSSSTSLSVLVVSALFMTRPQCNNVRLCQEREDKEGKKPRHFLEGDRFPSYLDCPNTDSPQSISVSRFALCWLMLNCIVTQGDGRKSSSRRKFRFAIHFSQSS